MYHKVEGTAGPVGPLEARDNMNKTRATHRELRSESVACGVDGDVLCLGCMRGMNQCCSVYANCLVITMMYGILQKCFVTWQVMIVVHKECCPPQC